MRWLIALGLTFITFGGCSLEEALENAPCDSDDDCLGDQTCVRTQHQLANESVGLCRSNGECAAGEQEGCIATGTGCSFSSSLTAVMGTSGTSYCCPSDFSGEGTIVVEAQDQSSAWCITVDEIVMCDDAMDCIAGVACVRTLEQEAEPDDTDDQEVEPGWCLPDGCLSGSQEGCRIETEESCGSALTKVQVETRYYCCETEPSGYTAHVYEETESAACILCPTDGCAACTALDDPACTLTNGGPCGCVL